MKNPNRIWTIVAIVLMILPFAALGFELAKTESATTIAVFAVMALLLIGTFTVGLRAKATSPGDDRDANAVDASSPARPQR